MKLNESDNTEEPLDQDQEDRVKIDILSKEMGADEWLFCEEYLKCLSVPVAMARACPHEERPIAGGRAIFTRPHVQDYLSIRKRQIQKCYITKDDLLLKASDVLDKCTEPVPVLDKRGQPTGEMTFEAAPATRLLELMFKHLKMTDSGTHTDGGGVTKHIVNVTEEAVHKFDSMFNTDY